MSGRFRFGLLQRVTKADSIPARPSSARIERGFPPEPPARPTALARGLKAHGRPGVGYHFTADSLTLAVGTLVSFVDRATRLYEQARRRPKGPSPLGAHVKRWCAWASGGLATIGPRFTPLPVEPRVFGGRAGLPVA